MTNNSLLNNLGRTIKKHIVLSLTILLCFLLSIAYTIQRDLLPNMANFQSSLAASLFAQNDAGCWHNITGGDYAEQKFHCDDNGCEYPDGTRCDHQGCYAADGTLQNQGETFWDLNQNNIDHTCRDANGNDIGHPGDDDGGHEGCVDRWDPVCGIDGVTYDDDCHAREAGIHSFTHGECPTRAEKPNFDSATDTSCYHKVTAGPYTGQLIRCNNLGCEYPDGGWCDTHGQCYHADGTLSTHDNLTFTSRSENQVDYDQCVDANGNPEGTHDDDDDDPDCPSTWNPVCGIDGVTYDNDCKARVLGITNYTSGQCIERPPDVKDDWVRYTWHFKDDNTESTYILGRTDKQYLDYIKQVDNQCRATLHRNFKWMPKPGDDSPDNWLNFGIPYCIPDGEPVPIPTFPLPVPVPSPPPGTNWINHTWKFLGGETENSWILNRTDREYIGYIKEIDQLCQMTSHSQLEWERSAGDDSPENWRNFGIPICPGPSVCPTDYDPVCGENGKTYSNGCSIKNAGVKIAHRGECNKLIIDCDYNDYTPVCGMNGHTYVNECDANQSNVEIDYHGECHDGPDDGDDHSLREKERWFKDRSRELSNFRHSDINTIAVENLFDQFSDLLEKARSAFEKNEHKTYQNHLEELENIRMIIDHDFSGLYFEQRLSDAGRTLKDMKRQLKDYLRESDGNGKQFQTMIDKYTGILTSVREDYYDAIAVDGGPTPSMEDRINYELNDLSRDFFDSINEAWQNIHHKNEKDDIKRIYKDSLRFMKDKERIIKDMERDGVKTSQLKSILQKMNPMVTLMKEFSERTDNFDMRDFWDLNADFGDLDRDFWDLNEELNRDRWADQEKENSANILRDKERMLTREMGGECERVSCSTEQKSILANLQKIHEEMKSAREAENYEEFWDLDWEFNDLSRDFWDTLDHSRRKFDVGKWLKDITRMIKDHGRWVHDLFREAKEGFVQKSQVEKLETLLEEMKKVSKKANDFYQEENYDKADDILQSEFEDLRWEFDNITGQLHNQRERQFFKEELRHMQEEIKRIKRNIQEATVTGEISQKRAEQCLGYVAQGQEFLDKLKEIYDKDDKSEIAREVQERFRDLEHRANSHCGDLFYREPDFTSINDFIDDDHRDDARAIFEQLSKEVIHEIIAETVNNSGFINEILATVKEEFHKNIADTLEATAFIPEEYHNEILSHKSEILRLTQEVEDLKGQIQLARTELDQLTEVQNQLAGYNFIGSSGTQIETEVEDFLARANTLSPTQIKAELKSLKKKTDTAINASREEKFEKRIIPFRDTDDNQWFTRYVKNVADEGIVSGYRDASGRLTGEYGPANPVTVGEIMKMALEGMEIGPATGQPANAAARGHWAEGYFKQAENLGISIVKEINNLDRPATRAEVIALVMEAKGIRPAARTAPFNDVPTTHSHAGVIGEAKAIGLVSGDEGGTTFRPDSEINRAETAKVVDKAVDLLTE